AAPATDSPESICSGPPPDAPPGPGLVQQTDQIAASAIYPYSLEVLSDKRDKDETSNDNQAKPKN
ncbi:hypothetical protein, partial [Roseateles sp. LKC17W]